MAKRKQPDDSEDRIYFDAFWMPSVQTMVSRISSITNAFVNSLLPIVQPTSADIRQALSILKMEPNNLRCSYCGDKATEWDHLRPIVVNLRPTGYISEIANLVPSCNKCNQSKRNQNWKVWMLGNAALSPTSRRLLNISELVGRLENYEKWRTPIKIDFEHVLGKETFEEYWAKWDKIKSELRDCQVFADSLRLRVLEVIPNANINKTPTASDIDEKINPIG